MTKTRVSATTSAWVTRLNVWRWHHRLARQDTLARLRKHWGSTLLTSLVIGAVVSLPAVLGFGVMTLEQVTASFDRGESITVLLEGEVSNTEADTIISTMTQIEGVASATLLTREQALADLSGWLDVPDALLSNIENPLPDSVILTLSSNPRDELDTLVASLEQLEGVTQVIVDLEWLSRLQALSALGYRLVLLFGLMACLACVLIIANTTRLAVEGRRQEILVAKLVGASDAYVQRPFFYTGVLYGLFGGCVAILIVVTAGLWLGNPIASLKAAYDLQAVSLSLPLSVVVAVIGGSVCLGAAGAWGSARRQLRRIEP